jgi:hypothetical protein
MTTDTAELRRALEALGLVVEKITPGRNGGALVLTSYPDRSEILTIGVHDEGTATAITLDTARARSIRDALTEWLTR